MNVYLSDILTACILFPVVAFLITVPYMIYQYRRRGSVPKLHTAIVYSFVFYLMCAYFLVLLPLPADRTAYVAYAATSQLVPFNFVHEFLAETTFFSKATPQHGCGFCATRTSTRRSSMSCCYCR